MKFIFLLTLLLLMSPLGAKAVAVPRWRLMLSEITRVDGIVGVMPQNVEFPVQVGRLSHAECGSQ